MKRAFVLSIFVAAILLVAGSPAAADDPLVTVDFDRANLSSAFSIYSELMHVSIVMHPSIRGTVSLHLKDVPLSESFNVLLRIKALYAIREGHIVVIYPLGMEPGE